MQPLLPPEDPTGPMLWQTLTGSHAFRTASGRLKNNVGRVGHAAHICCEGGRWKADRRLLFEDVGTRLDKGASDAEEKQWQQFASAFDTF